MIYLKLALCLAFCFAFLRQTAARNYQSQPSRISRSSFNPNHPLWKQFWDFYEYSGPLEERPSQLNYGSSFYIDDGFIKSGYQPPGNTNRNFGPNPGFQHPNWNDQHINRPGYESSPNVNVNTNHNGFISHEHPPKIHVNTNHDGHTPNTNVNTNYNGFRQNEYPPNINVNTNQDGFRPHDNTPNIHVNTNHDGFESKPGYELTKTHQDEYNKYREYFWRRFDPGFWGKGKF